MAVTQPPFKILEIIVSSAQELPPVSKMLRTFTVAWIHPDQKLSTRIDHHGHTNPTWNYKLVFRVDDKFLRNETACVTFEIYNVAWLRDLPIGTAYLFINHIAPPLVQNSPATRPVSLYIRRPTGHLQGILHVGVSLIDNNVPPSPLASELSALAIENQDSSEKDDDPSLEKQNSIRDSEKEIEKVDETVNPVLQKQPSVHGYGEISIKKDGKESKGGLKTMLKNKSFASTHVSSVTIMHPLPSEVALSLKKGFYAADGDEYGSSIFENWSEPSDRNSVGLRSRDGKWRMESTTSSTLDSDILMPTDEKPPLKIDKAPIVIEKTPLMPKVQQGHKPSRPKRRKNSGGKGAGGGLFSCFGKGFEFTFAYGSKTAKNTIPKIPRHEKLHVTHPDSRMHRFHI
ncbi:OLC1v1025881C1 [Oldenlandia corymbosa var. corymbosa]|uniref:OLC1v1025881C1 n=1 Tax=Oldenlandia corymbosa var. corymbosa TaxID=529605 RepID=A0AAV1C7U5_OLDCO|nr:OLC1v1025881C1 [Oldenlandia corymbosa var. corymbosa]